MGATAAPTDVRVPWAPILLAIANSLVQLGGVVFLDWPIGNIFLLLWIENVIVTLVAIGRMAPMRNAPDGGFGAKFNTSFGLLFFCLIHGVFSATLAFMTGVNLSPQLFLTPVLLLVVRYVVEVIGWYAGGQRPATLSQAHGFAMRRVVMLHFAIIACWFVMIGGSFLNFGRMMPGGPASGVGSPLDLLVSQLGGLPLVALGVLLLIKTLTEIHAIRLGPNAPTTWKFQAG